MINTKLLSTLGLGGAFVIGCAALLFWLYGTSKRAEGLAMGRAECIKAQMVAQDQAARDKEAIANEVSQIDDIDGALRLLGIMRQDTDR
jgi:hypothetical protein